MGCIATKLSRKTVADSVKAPPAKAVADPGKEPDAKTLSKVDIAIVMTPEMEKALAIYDPKPSPEKQSQANPVKIEILHLDFDYNEIVLDPSIKKSVDIAIPPSTPARPYPKELTALRSAQGMRYLCAAEGGHGGSIHNLAPHMIGQGALQCTVTSLAVALNSMALTDKKKALRFCKDELYQDLYRTIDPTPRHTLFSVSLDELAVQAARCVAMSRDPIVRTTALHANETTVKEFRHRARKALISGGAVIVNFSRQTLGYTTSAFAGHCSPVAAYHEATDSFLVMDVAIKSWEPVWVPAALLFKAMDTIGQERDTVERRYFKLPAVNNTICRRGFILFERESTALVSCKGMKIKLREIVSRISTHYVPSRSND